VYVGSQAHYALDGSEERKVYQMKKIILVSMLLASMYTPVAAQECEQGPYYGDCSRNNQNYRHGRSRSRVEPYYHLSNRYKLHQRAASRRQGYHERAESYRRR
jgi:hypothetical protein